MSAEEIHVVTEDVEKLTLIEKEDQNPWQDKSEEPSEPVHRLQTPDPQELEKELSSIEDPSSLGQKEDSDLTEEKGRRTSAEVLEEFDPLASRLEQDARDAWESAEGHPPQPSSSSFQKELPQDPSDQPEPITPQRSQPFAPSSSPSPSLSFPSSLTAFAKSFSLPSKIRSRSLDAHSEPNVLSPTSISTFANQQHTAHASKGKAPIRQQTHDTEPAASSTTTEEEPVFDFQKFLDQMKTKGAEPVAKYLRSFLSNFAKRSFTINDQVKVINDFLGFIAGKMRETDIWRSCNDAEFDLAMEAMEKLVMNRLYEFTFTPQLAEAIPSRRITTDDLERDRVLAQRIALFGWVEEKHLDVPEGNESRGFLMFAQQELLKINHYKAPRDKLICVLNCCKVIFGLIRHLHKEENADSFVPILIYVVLRASPPNLISNIEYINRFRNPEKLQSEAGYYLSSLMGAVSFVETMDHSSLSNITAEEFERNVEDAIHDLPDSPVPFEKAPSLDITQTPPPNEFRGRPGFTATPFSPASPHAGEESAQPLSLSLGQGVGGLSFADDTRRILQRTGDTLSKPLSALGKMLGEVMDGLDREISGHGQSAPPGQGPGVGSYLPGPFAPLEMARERERGRQANAPSTPFQGVSGDGGISTPQPFQAPYKPRVRHFPSNSGPTTPSSGRSTPDTTPSRPPPSQYQNREPGSLGVPPHVLRSSSPFSGQTGSLLDTASGLSRASSPGLDIPGLQAEIDRAHERAASAALGTLTQIFPGADREIMEWVLEAENGDLGKSIEKMLEISGGTAELQQ